MSTRKIADNGPVGSNYHTPERGELITLMGDSYIVRSAEGPASFKAVAPLALIDHYDLLREVAARAVKDIGNHEGKDFTGLALDVMNQLSDALRKTEASA